MLTSILLSGIVIFCSFTLEAITGFGCTVIALPFITTLLGMKEGVIILTIMALLLALYIVITNLKHLNIKEFVKIIALMLIGLPIGMYLSRSLDVKLLKTILAFFIIIVSVFQLIIRFVLKKKEDSKIHFYSYIALFAAGIVHGMFSSGGPLAILYTTKALPEKKQFRSTLCLLWTSLNIILVANYIINKQITKEISMNILYLFPFMILGIIFGEFVHNKVNSKVFTILIFISLLTTGIFMLI